MPVLNYEILLSLYHLTHLLNIMEDLVLYRKGLSPVCRGGFICKNDAVSMALDTYRRNHE